MNVKQKQIAHTVIRVVNFAVDLIIILCLTLVIGFALYNIWENGQTYALISSERYDGYSPIGGDGENSAFSSLQEMNPDVIGWISISGTSIDYPLLHCDNNSDYLGKDAFGNNTLGGSIFLSAWNSGDFSDFNSIIYGHHMEHSTVFGDIDKFDDENFFNSHPSGDLYYNGVNHEIVFFAMADADAYDFDLYDENTENRAEYLSYIRTLSKYTKDECWPTTADHIVMMSTCSEKATNGRYVLFGKIIDEASE